MHTVTPESVGISSRDTLHFIRMLDDYGMHIHSIILSRDDSIFAEGYYAPFHEAFLHRMYSSSKTFIAMAIGVALTEGLLSLDDVIVDYFPEWKNENVDIFHEECTIRDMLKMQSNIGTGLSWWGKFQSRVEAYYSMKTSKVAGTQFMYDSIGSFLLGVIVERLTGKTFLDYLKEKVLYDIGFSKESYTLFEPGGYTVGDSGILCTARDLWLFARWIMKKGEWEGRQYIDRAFMEEAISNQSFNHFDSGYSAFNAQGYGYLIWQTFNDCFLLSGMGDQIAVCHPKSGMMLTMTADNQGNATSRGIILHEFCKHFLPLVSDTPLAPHTEDYLTLKEYLDKRTLVSIQGAPDSPWAKQIDGVRYVARENKLGLREFTLYFDTDGGRLHLVFSDKETVFHFGLCKNKFTKFSYGTRAKADMMGVFEEGAYDTAISGGWVDDSTFGIMAQVIDTYFGSANAYISFKGERATLLLKKSGQYVFDGYEGYAIFEKDGR